MTRAFGVDGRAVIVSDRGLTQNVIPDSVVTLYEFEDTGDTTTAIDSVGSNNASINGATYTTDAAVGSNAMDGDGVDDQVQSNSTVDLVASGSNPAVSVSVWAKGSDSGNGWVAGWKSDSKNNLAIQAGGTWNAFLQVGSTNVVAESNVSSDSSWQHIVSVADQSEVRIYVDNTLEGTQSHSLDITNIGGGNYVTNSRDAGGNTQAYGGIVDDTAFADDALGSSAVNKLYQRGV